MIKNIFSVLFLFLLPLALAVNVTFSVSSIENNLNFGALMDKPELDTENYFFITGLPMADVYDYNATTKYVSLQADGIVSNIFMGPRNESTILSIGLTVKPEPLNLDANNKLLNYNFWACLNIDDPMGYSAKRAMIFITARGNNTAPFRACTRVSLTMVYVNPITDPNLSSYFINSNHTSSLPFLSGDSSKVVFLSSVALTQSSSIVKINSGDAGVDLAKGTLLALVFMAVLLYFV